MQSIFEKIIDNRLIATGFVIPIILSIFIGCKNNRETITPVRKNIVDDVFA